MRRRDESGSAAVETVLIVPVLVALLMFAVFGGRLATAKNHVVSAAQDAARAASLRDDPAAATADATATAESSLAAAGISCSSRDVTVDANLEPGGLVTVRVRCTTPLSDLALLGLPGSRTLSATATERVDTYRSQR
jgi:Flp pilus assembly protein TadG